MLDALKTVSVSRKALLLCLLPLMLWTHAAEAVEVLGVRLFGAEPVVHGLTYEVTVDVANDDSRLTAVVTNSSLLIEQQKTGSPDRPALVSRARADAERLAAVLQSEGRFGAQIRIEIDGKPLDDALADEGDDTTPASVRIAVAPGPEFVFGLISFSQSVDTPNGPSSLNPADYGLSTGEPVRPAAIAAAINRLVEAWRAAGYPFAQIVHRDIAADHATAEVRVDIRIAPGEPAVYGWINVIGSQELSSAKIADMSALEPGQPFKPTDLKRTRDRLRKFESIESVRVVEGDALGPDGGIPITLEVTERKPRYFGGTASVSTLDGAELSAYWGHRNLFGEGERLRIDATISNIGNEGFERLQFSTGATYAKPGMLDIDTDLFAEFRLEREVPESYESFTGFAKLGLARRFSPYLNGTVAASVRQSHIDDAFGTNDYSLLSLPADLVYDTRDNKMDARRGVYSVSRLSPTFDVAGGNAYVATGTQLAAYLSFDEMERAILAGRVAFESVVGASLADVPATDRIFAGGGGSVRGYEYRSLGPMVAGEVTGGLSLISASLELRLKVTPAIGIVPFIDVASVSDESFPTFSGAAYVGAGVGLRYFTAIGPLRLDVAVPLTEKDGRDDFGVYVGLGQAF